MTTRRRFLVAVSAALAAPPVLAQRSVAELEEAQRRAAEEALRRLTGGAPVREGRVRLDVPPLIDNGNSVPLSVAVESPMTPADHVRAVHVLAEKNPQPFVLSAFFGARSGAARVSTRARIADSQTLTAIARMSDGSFWSDSVHVIVTVPACSEDSLT